MKASPVQILTAVIIGLASVLAVGKPATVQEQRVRSATMVYGMASPTEEEFQRLLEAQALDYLLVHVGLSARGESLEKEKRRVRALSATGKRIVLGLWWGPEDWGYNSWPHFAFDGALLDKFMAERVEPRLAGYEPGEIYGVHLLEETGIAYGIDYQAHTDPEDPFQLDPELSKRSYGYSLYYAIDFGRTPGGPETPNLLRYNDRFKKQTGLNMRTWQDWTFTDRYVFDRWCSRQVQAAGHAAVLRRIKQLRPDLKVYAWDFPFSEGGTKRT